MIITHICLLEVLDRGNNFMKKFYLLIYLVVVLDEDSLFVGLALLHSQTVRDFVLLELPEDGLHVDICVDLFELF